MSIAQFLYPAIEEVQDHGDFTVLFAGRHEESKGIDVFANAIPRVAQKYPQVKFVFVGRDTVHPTTRTSYREYLKEQLQKFCVKFYDAVNQKDLADHFRKCTLCVFPSFFAGGATMAIEAASCGIPSVVSGIEAFVEYFQDHQNALVVPINDSSALASAIIELLDNKELRLKIRRHALITANEFDLERIIEEALNIYHEAIQKFQMKGSGNPR